MFKVRPLNWRWRRRLIDHWDRGRVGEGWRSRALSDRQAAQIGKGVCDIDHLVSAGEEEWSLI